MSEYVRRGLCQTCQCTKAKHGGPRRVGMIGVDWIAEVPPTVIQTRNCDHVDLQSGKVHAVLTRLTNTAVFIRDMCLRFGTDFLDVLVLDHDAKITSKVPVFSSLIKSMGSSLIVGLTRHKNTNVEVERSTASSATRSVPMPTAAWTIGKVTSRLPSSTSTMQPRRLATA